MKTKLVLAVTLAAVCGALPALAGDHPGDNGWQLAPGPDAERTVLEWSPQAEAEGYVLTVSGPDGAIVREQFARGEPPVFWLDDATGARRSDGVYRYELRVAPQGPVIGAGTFAILDGTFLAGTAKEPEASRPRQPRRPFKELITGNLTVRDALCVGTDCLDAESFGFDSIRLKENNIRIKFDDTSTLAGFPANDWQITANDTGSGGLNRFSIDDVTGVKTPFTIEAGAPTNSVYVSLAGRVGLGTNVPADRLHVNGNVRITGGSFIDDGVTLMAPDYVFEPDYALRPLDELAAFVAKEKHLPNVPSAADIRQGGLNLSQFQMRLLEKVEELTLYTLEQHQRLNALEAENAALKRRLSAVDGIGEPQL